MQQRQRLFIYDRKEMGVLLLLGLMVALFAFTLGVHLGKRVTPTESTGQEEPSPLAASTPDKSLTKDELIEQSKGGTPPSPEVQEYLTQSLQEEVSKTGLKLDSPRQIELPNKPRSANAGATGHAANHEPTPAHSQPKAKTEVKAESGHEAPAPAGDHAAAPSGELPPAAQRAFSGGKYILQVGSHPDLNAAKGQLKALEGHGIAPLLREAEVKGKGKWFRIYVGGYPSKEDAEHAGKLLQSEHKIDAFVVSNVDRVSK